ncbi:hypothetical protein KRZ98_16340 [Sphingobium sp. AS12]|uniref:hypothetical protein n=1 Tax=Sphingobium sp. AS12 TaxID=2849495 RepID=UPI001C31CA38|nr:hypothetical protein [Sphingobium sp. AS12]MBV2149816.1 hypothetical protein [Sphingobium sp. AS12]
MERTATVRIRFPGATGGIAPSRTLLEQAAHMLEEHGFAIQRIGRRGVSVKADQATYLRELGVTLPARGSVVEAPEPHLPLSRLVDLVEAAEAPVSF